MFNYGAVVRFINQVLRVCISMVSFHMLLLRSQINEETNQLNVFKYVADAGQGKRQVNPLGG